MFTLPFFKITNCTERKVTESQCEYCCNRTGGTNCIRCFELTLRSLNVVQIHTEGLDKCYTTEEAAMATCPTDESIATGKSREIMLYSESPSFFSSPPSPFPRETSSVCRLISRPFILQCFSSLQKPKNWAAIQSSPKSTAQSMAGLFSLIPSMTDWPITSALVKMSTNVTNPSLNYQIARPVTNWGSASNVALSEISV